MTVLCKWPQQSSGWRYVTADDVETAEADINKAANGLSKAEAGSIRLPNFTMPPLMNNHGAYIGLLGNVCRWLAERAEALMANMC